MTRAVSASAGRRHHRVAAIPARLSRWALAGALALLLVVVPLVGLVGAELVEPDAEWTNGFMHSVEMDIRGHEELHYGVHLTLGRVLAVCPCTRKWSDLQYRKAKPHAHTPRQTALVTDQRPQLHSPKSVLRDTLRIAASGLKWASNHLLSWAER